MGRPRAGTIACSLLLLLSVCTARSIAADEPEVGIAAAAPWVPTAAQDQLHFLIFADAILHATNRRQPPQTGLLFADPVWLMPLPDFSASTAPAEHKSASAPSRPANVVLADPAETVPDSPLAPGAAEQDSEPFGVPTARAPRGLLWTKWRKVQHAIEAEAPALTRCRGAASRCSPAVARFVAIVDAASKRQGRARLELVNERVNAAIHYTSDMKQWHLLDRWSAPLDTRHKGSFDTGMGDCEDYAIAKYVALRNAGTPARDLRLLMVRDTTARTYHAVLAARHDGNWLLLDNRWRRLIEDTQAPFFTPLFALNAAGVERFAATSDSRPHLRHLVKTPEQTVSTATLGVTRGYD